MLLTKKERNKFNDFFNKLFDVLDFNPRELQMNGSFANKLLALYSGDIDLYELIPMNKFNKWFDTSYQDAKNELRDRLIELKAGDTKYKTFVDMQTLKKGLDESDNKRIKIDFFFIVKGYPLEMSMIYDFGKKLTNKSIIQGLLDDMTKFFDEENYYKVFKRLGSLYDIKGIKNKQLRNILINPFFGNLYVIISRLETMKKVFTKQQKKPFLELIKEDLRELGLSHMYKPNVEAMINTLKVYLNKSIYHHIEQFKSDFS